MKRFDKSHVEIINKDNGAEDYCMKEDSRVAGPFRLERAEYLAPKHKLTLRE